MGDVKGFLKHGRELPSLKGLTSIRGLHGVAVKATPRINDG